MRKRGGESGRCRVTRDRGKEKTDVGEEGKKEVARVWREGGRI